MQPACKTYLTMLLCIGMSGCGGSDGGTSGTLPPSPNPSLPIPDPAPSPSPDNDLADLFQGSWLRGKTQFNSGNCNIYKLVLLKESATALRATNERVTFNTQENNTCSGELLDIQEHVVSDFELSDLDKQPLSNSTSFYPVTYATQSQAQPEQRTLAFKHPNAFCLLTASTAAQVQSQLDQITDPLNHSNCYSRSTEAFSLKKPVMKSNTAEFRFEPAISFEHVDTLLPQLNELGQQGYLLLGNSWSYDSISKNVYIKIKQHDHNYHYRSHTRTANSVADDYFSWFDQLQQQGQAGYQFVHKIRPDTSLTFIDYFIKKDQSNTTYSYDRTYFHPIPTQEQIESQLNALGSQGCRVIEFKRYFTGLRPDILNGNQNQPKIATCVKRSDQQNSYQYRYYKRPKTNSSISGANTRALQNLINEQAKQGFQLIHTALDISNTEQDSLLFMRDSSNTSNIEYKVFNDSVLVANPSHNTLQHRLQSQADLGWLITNNQAIYTNRPETMSTVLGSMLWP